MKDIEKLLLKLQGVMDIARVDKDKRSRIIELESIYEKGNIIGLHNLGIINVLKCSTVYAILKDTNFRPPSGPTVYMVEDIDDKMDKTKHQLNVGNKGFHIIGEEVIPENPLHEEYSINISDSFVIYPKRRKGHRNKPAYFLIPPIDFPELERIKEDYKISNIISVSPSTRSDMYIRELYDFLPSEALATILVGFDTIV